MTAVLDRPEIAAPTPAVDTRNPYDKLADLILEGARKRPQSWGWLFSRNEETGVVHSCAIGACMDALGYGPDDDWAGDSSKKEWNQYERILLACDIPANAHAIYPGRRWPGLSIELTTAIYGLNDYDRWTREDIAAWVRTLKGTN